MQLYKNNNNNKTENFRNFKKSPQIATWTFLPRPFQLARNFTLIQLLNRLMVKFLTDMPIEIFTSCPPPPPPSHPNTHSLPLIKTINYCFLCLNNNNNNNNNIITIIIIIIIIIYNLYRGKAPVIGSDFQGGPLRVKIKIR